ncbi:hypothetical protein [Gordonia sp. 'Campus']|nr:hypothetical protein [Gordonia sp. 'Campus']
MNTTESAFPTYYPDVLSRTRLAVATAVMHVTDAVICTPVGRQKTGGSAE